jgi:hypothetical protein
VRVNAVARGPLLLLGAGVVGAVATPVWRPGIGWPIAAVAVVAAVVGLRRISTPAAGPERAKRAPGDTIWRVGAVAASLVLVAVAAVRAAEWFVALCLLVAVPLAAAGLAGGSSWLGLGRGVVTLPWATVAGLVVAARGTAAHGSAAPGTAVQGDAPARGRADRAALAGAARVAAGVVVGGLLVCVFGALFWAADAAFADLLHRWSAEVSVAGTVRAAIGFALVVGLAAGLAHAAPAPASTHDRPRARLGVPEWAIPIVMLDALFAIFVWVQLTVLFGGEAYVLGPGGPDYAVYARGGFVQLVWVTVLTLGVLAALAIWVRRETRGQRVLLRVLAGVLCVLTLVIVTSALRRMGLYAQAYGFTVPRLIGYVGEVWLGLVFALVIVAGVRLRAPWLPRATVAAGVGLLIALTAINPEALMARTLLSRLDGPYPVDRYYVALLSADAVEEIDRVPEPERSCLLARLADDLQRPDPWYAWNPARDRARELLARRPIRVAASCMLFTTPPRVAG